LTGAGLANIEQIHSALNRDGVSVQIDGVRVPEVGRCHVLLRQMDSRETAVDKHIARQRVARVRLRVLLRHVDSRETAVDKHIVLDLANTDDLQTLLRQVLPFVSSTSSTTSFHLNRILSFSPDYAFLLPDPFHTLQTGSPISSTHLRRLYPSDAMLRQY